DGEFKWDEELQGIILSGFFYGYAAGQLLGGQLAERFGGKIVYGLGTFIAAALTVVSPQCAWISDKLLFAVRLLEGLAEGLAKSVDDRPLRLSSPTFTYNLSPKDNLIYYMK
ncbi:unnamed protein product, partial [Timema podura]|nr:unnamed protein product [Timema podura]